MVSMRLIVCAGPAGSGKSTLADAVASALDVVHLDFDVVTRELVDERRRVNPMMSEQALLEVIKDDRYALLASVVKKALDPKLNDRDVVVVSAPFTRHMASNELWLGWLADCGAAGEDVGVQLVWLAIEPELRLVRMRQRASGRDTQLLAGNAPLPDVPAPVIAHVRVDAADPLDEQCSVVMSAVNARNW